MVKRTTRLELTWVGKDSRPNLEPRILIEEGGKSYHAVRRISENDHYDNRLVYGDNLLALKSLEQEFTGMIQCVYIDPPFNTGQAFEHYDDGLEHSTWLGMMNDRMVLLHRLLAPGGVLFVHLDQEENHYMKVLLDELYGRPNFLGQVAYERSGVSGIGQGGAFLVNTHEYILCYAKDRTSFHVEDDRGATFLEQKDMKRYNRVLVDPGDRVEISRFIAPATGEPVIIYRHSGEQIHTISLRKYEERYEEIVGEYVTHYARVFRNTSIQKENEFQTRILSHCGDGLYSADYLVSRGKREGERITAYYWNRQVFAWLSDTSELREGQIVKTNKLSDFWSHGDLPKADLANEGGVDFRRGKKPETLLKRLIGLVTKPGDWVLDSFAGSGSTGAVAHKMGRRWIMVELGEHCHTHIIPRMKKVIDGDDQSGISKAVNWKGGGGFRYYKIGPSLIVRDGWGNPIINPEFNAGMLTEAMCKLEGFVFEPNAETYWKHGRSSESDFIFVTTQMMTKEMLSKISDDVGPHRSLLICCGAFRCDVRQFTNMTVKKIPKAVLKKCEWGHDDYSLEIRNLPAAQPREERPAQDSAREAAGPDIANKPTRKFGKGKPSAPTLFDTSSTDAQEGK